MTGKWRKSSRSSGNGGSCVELRLHNGSPQIRDSKLGDASPILDLSRADLTALLNNIRLTRANRRLPPPQREPPTWLPDEMPWGPDGLPGIDLAGGASSRGEVLTWTGEG